MKQSSNEGAPSVKEYYRSKENKEAIKGILEDPATKKLVEQEMTPEEISLALKYLTREIPARIPMRKNFNNWKTHFHNIRDFGSGDITATMPKRVMGQSAKKPEQK